MTWRDRTPEELAAAIAQNNEQAADHIAHNLNSPMVSENTRRQIADAAAKAAQYQLETKTAAERKQQKQDDDKAMRELCGPNSKYPETSPHYAIVKMAIDATPDDYNLSSVSAEDIKTQITLANIELVSRGQAVIADLEFRRIGAFLLAKRMAWTAENILIAYTVLCSEAGLRRPTPAAAAKAAVAAVVAQEEQNPFPVGTDEHNQFDRNVRYQQSLKEVEALRTIRPNAQVDVKSLQALQAAQPHLGLKIDPEDDDLSADEYAKRMRIGSSVLRSNATHGQTYTGNERKGA